MPRPRTEFNSLLKDILGSKYVYFQPPSTVKMTYPCIVYERSNIEGTHANNAVYKNDFGYTVTVIYTNPDSDLPIKVANIPTARHSSHFVSDNLYHDVYKIYY